MAPCGLASGIAGLLPQAATGGTPWIFRHCSAMPPMNATMFANTLEKFIKFPCWPRDRSNLSGAVSAVDHMRGAGHEGGPVRAHPYHRLRDVFRLTQASHGHLRHDLIEAF